MCDGLGGEAVGIMLLRRRRRRRSLVRTVLLITCSTGHFRDKKCLEVRL
jgi:hypothetical protein